MGNDNFLEQSTAYQQEGVAGTDGIFIGRPFKLGHET